MNEKTYIDITEAAFLGMWATVDHQFVWINYGGGSTWTHAPTRIKRVTRWITNVECEWEFTNETHGSQLDEFIRAKRTDKGYFWFPVIRHWMPPLPDDRLSYRVYGIQTQSSTRYILIGQPPL